MSRYETITNLGEDFLKLIKAGLIPVKILDYKVYYEAYLEHCKKEKPSEAINIVSAYYDISRRYMYTIVNYMKEGA